MWEEAIHEHAYKSEAGNVCVCVCWSEWFGLLQESYHHSMCVPASVSVSVRGKGGGRNTVEGPGSL